MEPILNEAKKLYNEPMHTCEHILNQTLVRMWSVRKCAYRAKEVKVRLSPERSTHRSTNRRNYP